MNRAPLEKSLSLLIALSVFSANVAYAELPPRTCSAAMKPTESTPGPSAISRAELDKSTFLEDATVKDQGYTGCCWLSSTLGGWERMAKAKFGAEVALDENYAIMASLAYNVKEAVYYGIEVSEGGLPEAGDWMAMHIGVVPETGVKWKKDLRAKGVSEDIYRRLNEKVEKFQIDLAALKAKGANDKQAFDFANKTLIDIDKALRDEVGSFPAEFEFKGKKYTPHSFAQEIGASEKDWVRHEYTLPEKDRFAPAPPKADKKDGAPPPPKVTEDGSLLSLYPDVWKHFPISSDKLSQKDPPTVDIMRYLLFGRSRVIGFATSEVSYPAMYEAIDKSLKRGQAVYLGFDVIEQFFKNETGVISIGAFKATAADVAKAASDGGHAVLITGVYRDASGEVLGFRIQNSWGPKAGNMGYYYMDRDYFERYMHSLVVREPPGTKTNFKPYRVTKPHVPTESDRPN
ncbi:MAG: hypothetical protein JST04_13835 [Bdellovibrionales bacterium]|nr:hypothetical protein [Bdellovibrionales bacterium]